MELSFLYHGFGIDRSYHYHATEYKDNSIILKLKSIPIKKVTCPHCGCTEVIRYGVIHRMIHNLPIGSKRTFLYLTVQRYQCKACGKVHQSDIPFTRGNVSYTYRFQRYVLDLLRLGGTTTDVAKHLGVGWDMVKDIHKDYLKKKYSHPDISKVTKIGIDEFAVRKGHVYKTIVVDLDTGRIIHVGDGKGSDSLTAFWKKVKRNNIKIELVTSDMSAAYISSVAQNAPQAKHVYDKFHVVELVNDAVDKVRRSVWNQENDIEKRKLIKGTRWMLLSKSLDKFDEESRKRFDNILNTNKPLFEAYYLKEDLCQIWMQKSKAEGEEQLEYWCARARESKLTAMIKVANTLLAKRTGILAWYDCKMTNAVLEGTNNKVKVLKRKAFGYRDDEYFKLLLLGMKDETVKTE